MMTEKSHDYREIGSGALGVSFLPIMGMCMGKEGNRTQCL